MQLAEVALRLLPTSDDNMAVMGLAYCGLANQGGRDCKHYRVIGLQMLQDVVDVTNQNTGHLMNLAVSLLEAGEFHRAEATLRVALQDTGTTYHHQQLQELLNMATSKDASPLGVDLSVCR